MIADYLATREQPAIDGILFPSAQKPDGGSNVVLFHKASAVQSEALPSGSEVSSTQGWENEEGFDIDYRVWVKVPKAKEKSEGHEPAFGMMDSMSWEQTYDYREDALKLDLNDLHVHHVSAVEYATSVHKVERHEIEKPKPPPSGKAPDADIFEF